MLPRNAAWPLVVAIAALGLHVPGALAQVVMDGSLGAPGALGLNPGAEYRITQSLGQTRGSNLFHSFSQFDVGTGQSAVFSGSSALTNIVSRVTGGTPSSIDGTIRSTAPNANVYLVNPRGVLFGANASLDVPRSFTASTANSVTLGTTGHFNAADTAASASVITGDTPSAFGFVSAGKAVALQGTSLAVSDGNAISVVGGDVTLTDATLRAPGGQVNLVATAGPGAVAISGADPSVANGTARGTTTITSTAVSGTGNVDTSGTGGGRILIVSGNLFLNGGRLKSETTGGATGQNLDIDLDGNLRASGTARIETQTRDAGDAGDIIVRSKAATFGGKTIVRTDTQFTGDGGDIGVFAQTLRIADDAEVNADTLGPGSGGNVLLDVADFDFSGATFVSARSGGPFGGTAGTITVRGGQMRASGEATLDTSSFFLSSGDGGRIAVDMASVQMNGDAWIVSNTFTGGAGGAIDLKADRVALLGSNAVSTTTFSTGAGGNVTVTAQTLVLSGASVISSGTEGTGRAGTVRINAGTVEVAGSATISSESEGSNFFVRGAPVPVASAGGGDGGDTIIEARTVSLASGGRVATGTSGTGAGGNVVVKAHDVSIASGGEVSARSDGTGVAGKVQIRATRAFKLLGGAVTTQALSSDGGNIEVKAGDLINIQSGRITTSVSNGTGNGGNIFIDPPFVVLNGATIVANANGGAGGNITLIGDAILSDPTTVIDASSALGIDGTIVIESPDDDVSGTLSNLPTEFLAADRLRVVRCAARTRADISTIVMRPRDGLAPTADDLLAASGPVTPLAPVDAMSSVHGDLPLITPGLDDPMALVALAGCGTTAMAAGI